MPKKDWPLMNNALMFVDSDGDGGGATPPPTGSNDGQQDRPDDKPPVAPKPAETVDFWKQKAREQERRAKDNADAARRLQEIEDASKSEQQRAADVLAKAQREAAEAAAEVVRYKAAATHGITGDDIHLIGTGDEDTVMGRAERIGRLLADSRELAAMREQRNAPTGGRPVPVLRPGATEVPAEIRSSAVDGMDALLKARGWDPGRNNSQ